LFQISVGAASVVVQRHKGTAGAGEAAACAT